METLEREIETSTGTLEGETAGSPECGYRIPVNIWTQESYGLHLKPHAFSIIKGSKYHSPTDDI